MKECYQFYYEDKEKGIYQLGSGYYKEPTRTKYYKFLESWFNQGGILSFGYQKIDLKTKER
jgi:hypothetical protein